MKLSTAVKMSEYFLPTLRQSPSGAEIISHQLMLRSSMIRQESSGIYSWLPLGFRVLTKVAEIISEEQAKIGAIEMLMPTIQSADLWKKSDRYKDYGKEMLKISDRHNNEMLFGPTNEEMITDLLSTFVQSYKDLPKNLFQIQWKFRDEIRPRFGVMRGREFLMKDGYGFAISKAEHKKIYNKIFISYLSIFARLGVKVIPMIADTGPIGGDLSHEFIIIADSGESEVFCDKKALTLDILSEDVDYNSDLEPLISKWLTPYSATADMHDESNATIKQKWNMIAQGDQLKTRGIEVGHIFYFGTKYSKPLGLKVADSNGDLTDVHMGSYGIGVSRVVAAIIESSNDEKGIKFPINVAPFKLGLINLRISDTECNEACEQIYTYVDDNFATLKLDLIYDDRDIGAGAKFSDMQLLGIPWTIVVGPRNIKNNFVELKNRLSGSTELLTIHKAIEKASKSNV